MNTFKSWRSYYSFERYVKRKGRFFFDFETKNFLDNILETASKRDDKLSKGNFLWRSQIGHDWEPFYEDKTYIDDVPCPFKAERMKPQKYCATEGRANPKGIPYLYLAKDRDTALAEARPWVGSLISIGQFTLLKDVKLINCTIGNGESLLFLDEPSSEKKEDAVWTHIDKAFAKPVDKIENNAEYVPTQVLAEFFKNNGYDGIVYGSSLGDGHNIVLFDIDIADIVNCTLFEARKINFEFTQSTSTYFQKKYYDNKNK